MRILPRALCVAAIGLLGSCVVGAPPGFSSGDLWSFPLVAPLEENEYLVPVLINDKGPYLFMVDPDSSVSSIDAAIRSELDLFTGMAPQQLDERDHLVPVALAEVRTLKVGDTLSVRNLKVRVHRFGTYSSGGRAVRGILGRDVIADSLIFAADRDRGVGYIATKGNYAAPPDANVISYRRHRLQPASPRRRLAEATINGTKALMHIDLGAATSQLWASKMDKLSLPRIAVRARTVDELATARIVSFGAMAAKVSAGGVEVNGLLMLPYEDKRTRDVDLDGSLGMNFFAGYNVVADWHHAKLYLSRRAADPGPLTAERIGRWGGAFDSCENVGCVTVAIESDQPARQPAAAPAAPVTGAPAPVTTVPQQPAEPAEPAEPKPVPPGGDSSQPPDAEPKPAPGAPPESRIKLPDPKYTLRVAREANAPKRAYDVLVEAVDAAGQPTGLPRLLVTLPAEQTEVLSLDFDATYAAAAGFRVLDVSPFPRDCQGANCVFQLMPKR